MPTKEEIKETIKYLKNKLNNDSVNYVGEGLFTIKEPYEVQLENDLYSTLNNYLLFDQTGNNIPLSRNYDGIFRFSFGIAVVVTRKIHLTHSRHNPQQITFGQEKKYGLIDTNGNDILPCIYDSISIHLDGFVSITKDGETKGTNIEEVLSGQFNWDDAFDFNS